MVVAVKANDRVADVLVRDIADLLDGVGLDVTEQRTTEIGAGQDRVQDLPAFRQQDREPRLPLERADPQHEADTPVPGDYLPRMVHEQGAVGVRPTFEGGQHLVVSLQDRVDCPSSHCTR